MRGLLPGEREMMETVAEARACRGEAERSGRPYTPSEVTRIELLVSQGRLLPYACGCGKRHVQITAEGREAMRLDALSQNLCLE